MLEMSVAAQKYHKVVEENRSLYNMVQDLKGKLINGFLVFSLIG